LRGSPAFRCYIDGMRRLAFVLLFVTFGLAARAAAQGALGPRDVAVLLAQRHVPAGVVAPTASLAVGSLPAPSDPAVESLDALLARFTASGAPYVVTQHDGLVRVVNRRLPDRMRERLEKPIDLGGPDDTTAVGLLVKVANVLRGHERPGNAAHGALPSARCPLSATVHVPSGSLSTLDALDRAARQVPGLSWFVTYDAAVPELDVALGWVCAGGETALVEVGP